jgi:capsular exopolysaccharide synthesis family protein
MSRVYEALRRAEDEHAGSEQGTIESASASEASRLLFASRVLTKPDSTPTGAVQTKPPFVVLERNDRRSKSTPSPTITGESTYSEKLPSSCGTYGKCESLGPLLVIGHREYPTVAEQFHRLSLNLRNWAMENDKRVFTVISALSQDGKSFVAANLAASLAIGGSPVILVDADLRQPVLHHSFNKQPGHGLIGYLRGQTDFTSCLQQTSLSGLLLVPAGGTSATPAELLAGTRMRDFIREARSMNPAHYIVIDSPACTMVPEPEILNRLGDASVVVVSANRTPRELVKQTIETIGGTTVCGLVLNRYEPPYSAVAHYPDRYTLRRGAGVSIRARMSTIKGSWIAQGRKMIRSLIGV